MSPRSRRAITNTLKHMQSESVRLDRDINPLDLGSRSGLLWSRDGLMLAGIGEAVRIPIERPAGGAVAQAALAELRGPDEVGLPGSGVVAFAALPFDPRSPGELIVPTVVIGRGQDGRRWLITTDISTDAALTLVDETLAARPMTPQPTRFDLESVIAPELWRDTIVAPVRDRVRAGEFNKVVLARELVLRTDQPLDISAVLQRLHQNYGTAALFGVDGFVGASPELLVSRTEDVVRAHPLAGTAPRSSDPAVDSRLSAGLVASAKDQTEHRITIDWLLDNLLSFCSYVDAEPEPTIISLANVHHLGTRVEGRLSAPAASVLELVAALHPTPALGGDPQAAALAVIEAHEPGERGLYGGPTGWVDGAGNGEFAVAIRSGQITGNEARVWAGVGVIAESDPEAELAETRSKFQAMLGALVRP